MSFDYTGSAYAIRDDIPDAHREIWRNIGQPGNWWRGEDRVAFVEESRNARSCRACEKRAAALSPEGDFGPHHTTTNLPELVVDIVHRLTTDPARLSRTWLDKVNAGGITDEAYVEILGVVVAAISIDALHRALGLPLEPLPAPVAGERSGYRPPGAADSGAWVHTVQPENASEAEADLYPGGRAGNVISAMSLVPDAVRMLKTLSRSHYLPMRCIMTPGDNAGRAISRNQIELVAGRISSLSDCFY